MDTERILKWVGLFLLDIMWAVMYAAGVLPPLLAELAVGVTTLMYGLPSLIKAGKAAVKQMRK